MQAVQSEDGAIDLAAANRQSVRVIIGRPANETDQQDVTYLGPVSVVMVGSTISQAGDSPDSGLAVLVLRPVLRQAVDSTSTSSGTQSDAARSSGTSTDTDTNDEVAVQVLAASFVTPGNTSTNSSGSINEGSFTVPCATCTGGDESQLGASILPLGNYAAGSDGEVG